MTDLKFAFRQLLKNPGFTATSVQILALGIAGNTVVFSLVNGLFMKPLPFPHSERLARSASNTGFGSSAADWGTRAAHHYPWTTGHRPLTKQ